MVVSILQSNYLPWKGYFHIILKSDVFVFYDDVQFTKNDWRNRNQIKTAKGLDWISIPCGQDLKRKINEVSISDPSWQKSHWGKILASYSHAPYFKMYKDFFEDFYLAKTWSSLSQLNQYLIREISNQFLDCQTEFKQSTDYDLEGDGSDRVLALLEKLQAKYYISGPAGKNYLEESEFVNRGIVIEYMSYSEYPTYQQLHGEFTHSVSILDMLFNCGAKTKSLILNNAAQ